MAQKKAAVKKTAKEKKQNTIEQTGSDPKGREVRITVDPAGIIVNKEATGVKQFFKIDEAEAAQTLFDHLVECSQN